MPQSRHASQLHALIALLDRGPRAENMSKASHQMQQVDMACTTLQMPGLSHDNRPALQHMLTTRGLLNSRNLMQAC